MLCGLEYKQIGLIFFGILRTKCFFTLSSILLHYIKVNMRIFLSTSLGLAFLMQNDHICGQICPRTRFAGSHLFSCLSKNRPNKLELSSCPWVPTFRILKLDWDCLLSIPQHNLNLLSSFVRGELSFQKI